MATAHPFDPYPPELTAAPGAAQAGVRPLIDSFHVSRQNTQTGRLTAAMFDAVLAEAKGLGGVA